MIEIITKDGISLDLSPDDEFEVEYESPLFADDHIPVPYSTSIAFLPTETNCRVFGYLDAKMQEPVVKKLDVDIYVSGIPLFSGSLEYESYEDGKLNYNFSGKSVEDSLSGYIHDVKGLTNASCIRAALGGILTGELADILERSRAGDAELDFGTPMIVSEEHIAEIDTPGHESQQIYPSTKFKNWHWSLDEPVAPAVRVHSIIEKFSPSFRVDLSGEALTVYEYLAVLGLYSREDSYLGFYPGNPFTLTLNVADKLPKCTKVDFLLNILKILCASVWVDAGGGDYVMMHNSDVLKSTDYDDWDGKVSDVYSLTMETGQVYKFEYKDEDSANTLDDEAAKDVDVSTLGLKTIVMYAGTEAQTIKETDTGDIFSRGAPNGGFVSMDILYRNTGRTEDDDSDTDQDTYDASTDFSLVVCVPLRSVKTKGGDSIVLMCPKVSFPALGGERMTDVHIGILACNQLTDKGFMPEDSAPAAIGTKSDGYRRPGTTGQNIDAGVSIIPGVLRDGLHKTFADWIESDRICASVDLNLSVSEISNLRLYRKVRFANREWLIKKLSVTFSCRRNSVSVSGDFVSVPVLS